MVAIEVKWSQKFEESHLAGIRDCARDLKGRHILSVVLYPGTELVALDKQTIAMPFGFLFGRDP